MDAAEDLVAKGASDVVDYLMKNPPVYTYPTGKNDQE
jgi:hypothetical protein